MFCTAQFDYVGQNTIKWQTVVVGERKWCCKKCIVLQVEEVVTIMSSKRQEENSVCFAAGMTNPLERRQFHELSFYQRVWVVKSACGYLGLQIMCCSRQHATIYSTSRDQTGFSSLHSHELNP